MSRDAMLHVLCAGAARAVVTALSAPFRQETGYAIDATFGAVGEVRERLDAGAACDVIVLTRSMIESLARESRASQQTAALGRVATGVAVREGSVRPRVDDASSLRDAIASASALYVPDLHRSTAGAHVKSVLERLDIFEATHPRIRAFANGALAMRALAADPEVAAIGCTQVTEIHYTPGVTLVDRLPAGFELTTEYVAAAMSSSSSPDIAGVLVEWLGGARSAALRADGGFEA